MYKKIIKYPYLLLTTFCLILFIIYSGLSFYIASRIVAPHPSKINVSPQLIANEYENITIKAADNITLKGWFFPAKSDKVIILISGIFNSRFNEDYYTVPLAQELHAQGYNLVLYDSRAHGESEGKLVTYGIKESQDIISVVNFAKAKGFDGSKIGIIGDSLGAISLLLASPQLQDIGALVVDSGATDIRVILTGVLQNENHIPAVFNSGTFWFMKYIYDINVDEIKPIDSLAKIPQRKFLFLHGALDRAIPLSNSNELLQKANPSSKLVIFPTGDHIETYKNDPQKYREAVFTFLNEEL